MTLASVSAMIDVAVLEVPQWQGSSSPTARRLVAGARSLAELLPMPHHVRLPVESPPRKTGETRGVRQLEPLTANLRTVRDALDQVGESTVVTVGGDCGVELGPIERARDRHDDRLAVVWFDAHADLNTPDSSPSGAFHGMVLRTLLGEGPTPMSPAQPLSPSQVVLAGVRALDCAERAFVDHHQIRHLGVGELADPLTLVEAVTATGADSVYVHIDLDVLDPQVFASVGVPEPGGLTQHRLAGAVRALARRFTIAGVGITEHQPTGARDTAVLGQIARTLSDIVAGSAGEDRQRIEQHAIGAWPAPTTQDGNGWLLRHTPGMRRLRSGNTALPLSPDSDPRCALSSIEAFYADRGLPATVQVSPALAHIELDEHLAERGYRLVVPIYVLTAATDAVAHLPAPAARGAATVSEAPTTAWRKAFVELDGHPDTGILTEQVISAITLPSAYLSIALDDQIVGTGLFVGGDDRWAGIYCMATHPDYRRRGIARAILRGGARWAADHGIPRLYLQVAHTNTAARNLYTGAGFTYGYSYHYRQLCPE